MGRRILAALLLGLLTGCAYYRIQEPAGGKEYYTDNWNISSGWNGAIGFKDFKSGDWVVLQQHQSRTITKAQFEAAIKAPATPAPYTAPRSYR